MRKEWMAAVLLALVSNIASAKENAPTNETLIVFVGEKISVEEFKMDLPPGARAFDSAFKVKYRVKQIVYGRYDGDLIEFEAYDHHGRPYFDKFKNSLMFVSRDGGKLYHEKYQFYPVFRAASGAWFGCGPTGPHEAELRAGISVARPMTFADDAFYPVSPRMPRESVTRWFPPRHFAVRGDKAFCLTGAPVKDLFEVKKRTVLKARGLFD